MQLARRLRSTAILPGLLLFVAVSGSAQSFPERPGQRDFIVDEANLIRPEDREKIKQICGTLLDERRIPIVVVTVPSLAKYGSVDIESYALALFDHWGIGSKVNSEGILLLVSVGNRKARIELGEGYVHTKDDTARMIMQEIIIPNFKSGDFSAGILQGVQALDTMARGLPVRPPVPMWKVWLVVGGMVAAGFIGVSLIRSGRKGWGWLILGILFAMIAGILFASLRGGGGGGSFGGGRGGGGGATGSW